MFGSYFYHAHIRRAITVFGSLFNNITTVRQDSNGKILSQAKVPLSYAPKQKFLARLKEERGLADQSLAIKLPRMSFEITDLSYDTSTKIHRGLSCKIGDGSEKVFYPIGYNISFQLNILSKHPEDGYQILEQILPFFQPEYTVTIKEVDDNFKTNMPFVLGRIGLQDDYEGDFITRRAIIQTLDFTSKVRFYGPIYGDKVLIKRVTVATTTTDMTEEGTPLTVQDIHIEPAEAGPDDEYEVIETWDWRVPDKYKLYYDVVTGGTFTPNETVIGSTSGATSSIIEQNDEENYILVESPDSKLEMGETVSGVTSGANFVVVKLIELWNTA